MPEEEFPEAAVNQAAGRLVGDTQRAEPDFKAENISENDVVSVPMENGRLLTHFGGELIARLHLGGTEGGDGVPKLPSQELHLYYVKMTEDGDYQNLASRVSRPREATRLVLMAPAISPDSKSAAAFLPQGISSLGREGTLKWYEYGPSRQLPEGWSPFNDSVSRRQLSVNVSDADREVAFIGMSKKRPDGSESKTVIEAPALTKRSQGTVTRQ